MALELCIYNASVPILDYGEDHKVYWVVPDDLSLPYAKLKWITGGFVRPSKEAETQFQGQEAEFYPI